MRIDKGFVWYAMVRVCVEELTACLVYAAAKLLGRGAFSELSCVLGRGLNHSESVCQSKNKGVCLTSTAVTASACQRLKGFWSQGCKGCQADSPSLMSHFSGRRCKISTSHSFNLTHST
eukprot:44842-Pelagomonas_calceolata.AAC.6